MKLSQHEASTPLWGKIEKHYSAELTRYRARIENPRIEEKERIELAWKIAVIKGLLASASEEQKSAEQ